MIQKVSSNIIIINNNNNNDDDDDDDDDNNNNNNNNSKILRIPVLNLIFITVHMSIFKKNMIK